MLPFPPVFQCCLEVTSHGHPACSHWPNEISGDWWHQSAIPITRINLYTWERAKGRRGPNNRSRGEEPEIHRLGGSPPRCWTLRRHQDISPTAARPSIQQVNGLFCLLFLYFLVRIYQMFNCQVRKTTRTDFLFFYFLHGSHLRILSKLNKCTFWHINRELGLLNIILKLIGTILIVKSFIQIKIN